MTNKLPSNEVQTATDHKALFDYFTNSLGPRLSKGCPATASGCAPSFEELKLRSTVRAMCTSRERMVFP